MDESQNYLPDDSEQLITELVDLNEELQTENEQYRTENKALQEQIQTLSSDRQRLLSTVQRLTKAHSEQNEQVQLLLSDNRKLKSRVAEQAEMIERLNESDLELKKAEELQNSLKEKEKNWKNELETSKKAVLRSEQKANTAIANARAEKEKAEKAKSEYDNLIANQMNIVQKKAESLNEYYRNRCQLKWFVILLYGVLSTLFTCMQSERIIADCTGFVMAIKDFFINGLNKIINIAEKAGNIGDKIEQPIVSKIASISLNLIVFVTISCAIIAVIYFVGKFVINVYKENCFDEISLFVVAVSVAVLVWFADFMPLNIILMLILSHVLYIVVRWYIKGYKENH